ncbi:Transmembrane protein [Actinidia chinensis var. chinensis]|uniref:Dolichyl-diphosphooligosaccharide-protein glycosyltransferase subunit OST5 n=1 Tax=Actinidia chinensis var. chinensis TaxID=1590841 RepID=A0A2R6Q534_ACTCC|nr:Transmembrane protein [Actinidia chinensis var. chinensis]
MKRRQRWQKISRIVIKNITQTRDSLQEAQSVKHISSPVLDAWFTTLAVFMFAIGLLFTAAFFNYGAKPSRKNQSLAKELTTGAVASVFLGFGSFSLLACGVCV